MLKTLNLRPTAAKEKKRKCKRVIKSNTISTFIQHTNSQHTNTQHTNTQHSTFYRGRSSGWWQSSLGESAWNNWTVGRGGNDHTLHQSGTNIFQFVVLYNFIFTLRWWMNFGCPIVCYNEAILTALDRRRLFLKLSCLIIAEYNNYQLPITQQW